MKWRSSARIPLNSGFGFCEALITENSVTNSLSLTLCNEGSCRWFVWVTWEKLKGTEIDFFSPLPVIQSVRLLSKDDLAQISIPAREFDLLRAFDPFWKSSDTSNLYFSLSPSPSSSSVRDDAILNLLFCLLNIRLPRCIKDFATLSVRSIPRLDIDLSS